MFIDLGATISVNCDWWIRVVDAMNEIRVADGANSGSRVQ